jgi:hypothetical protein
VATTVAAASLQFQKDQARGKVPAPAQFFFMPGMAPPNGGPDAVLREATTALNVVNEVSTAEQARSAVQAMASRTSAG